MDKRIRHAGLAAKVMTAARAAELVDHGMTIGMSGFTGAGYPKAVPQALAARMVATHERGEPFRVRVPTASICACRISPIRSCVRASIAARWTIWISISVMSRNTRGLVSSARSILP